jgi:hypothetical protein
MTSPNAINILQKGASRDVAPLAKTKHLSGSQEGQILALSLRNFVSFFTPTVKKVEFIKNYLSNI